MTEKSKFENTLGDISKMLLFIFTPSALLSTLMLIGLTFFTPSGFRVIEFGLLVLMVLVDVILIRTILTKKRTS